jgi:hypothetical protein
VAPLLAGGSVPSVAGAGHACRVEKCGSGDRTPKARRAPGAPRQAISLQGTTYARVGSCIRMEGKVAAENVR